MTHPRLELIYRPYAYEEEIESLKLSGGQRNHTIYAKKPVLTRKLDPFIDEYRSGILATDDTTEVRVYTSSIRT